MKIAFFGTPDFAIPSLELLVKSKHKVVCIVCQPDKPVGRGGKIEFSPVKQFGLTHGIPVLQPERISNEVHILDKYKPDIIVTCAFGQILKQNVLDYCKQGVINVHASLLPKYRGSSPIQWAIINGEKVTGVTIMQTDIGLDTGDIILSSKINIGDDETAGELFERLSVLGAEMLLDALETGARTPQDHSQATQYPMLSKEKAQIDFTKTAEEIRNFVRGMNPWPVAWFEHEGEVVRVYKASAIALDSNTPPSGHPFVSKGSISCGGKFVVPCADGFVSLDVIQLPGGKVLPAKDYINGRRIKIPSQ